MFSLLCFCLFHSAPSPPTPTFLEYINNYRKINSACTDIFLFSTVRHSSFYSWNYLIYQKNIFQSILAWSKHFNILHVEGSSTQTWVPCRVGVAPPDACWPVRASHCLFSSQTQPPQEGAEHWCIRPLTCPNPDYLLCIPSLQMEWHMGMPPPAFTEIVWVLNCLIPYLLGASLRPSCEKLLCSEEDHRLRLYTLTFTRCVRDACGTFPCCPC